MIAAGVVYCAITIYQAVCELPKMTACQLLCKVGSQQMLRGPQYFFMGSDDRTAVFR
jgi:hypothetical protein